MSDGQVKLGWEMESLPWPVLTQPKTVSSPWIYDDVTLAGPMPLWQLCEAGQLLHVIGVLHPIHHLWIGDLFHEEAVPNLDHAVLKFLRKGTKLLQAGGFWNSIWNPEEGFSQADETLSVLKARTPRAWKAHLPWKGSCKAGQRRWAGQQIYMPSTLQF